MIGWNGPPPGIVLWRIDWSRNRWRHMTSLSGRQVGYIERMMALDRLRVRTNVILYFGNFNYIDYAWVKWILRCIAYD